MPMTVLLEYTTNTNKLHLYLSVLHIKHKKSSEIHFVFYMCSVAIFVWWNKIDQNPLWSITDSQVVRMNSIKIN